MQKEGTLKFWDDFHETQGAKEWIVHPTADLFDLIYSECSRDAGEDNGQLRVLEIGCGTSTMAREFWKYLDSSEKECNFHIRSTDVSQVCVDACLARDKDMPNVSGGGQGDDDDDARGLEYSTLNVLETPIEADRGTWDAILDKACMDTFLFRSRSRGENKAYPSVVQSALDSIWTMMADNGVYMLLSPRTKLKAVRDFVGFSFVERRTIRSEEKGSIMSKKKHKPKERDEACYMYVCRKNLDYVIGETKAFRENYRILPTDGDKCPNCGLLFGVFRNGEDAEGRGIIFWTREWKNHCIHCKAPPASNWSPDSATR
jgi:hypothetical protein